MAWKSGGVIFSTNLMSAGCCSLLGVPWLGGRPGWEWARRPWPWLSPFSTAGMYTWRGWRSSCSLRCWRSLGWWESLTLKRNLKTSSLVICWLKATQTRPRWCSRCSTKGSPTRSLTLQELACRQPGPAWVECLGVALWHLLAIGEGGLDWASPTHSPVPCCSFSHSSPSTRCLARRLLSAWRILEGSRIWGFWGNRTYKWEFSLQLSMFHFCQKVIKGGCKPLYQTLVFSFKQGAQWDSWTSLNVYWKDH